MNLPLKSHEGTKVERKLPAFRIVTTETDDVEGKEVFVYKDLDELHKRVQKCNWITEKWYTTYENNAVKLTFNIEPHIVPYLKVVIDKKLQFTIIWWLCPGLPLEPKAMQGDKVLSTILCRIDLKNQQHLPVSTKMFSRDERCVVLCMDSNICCKCRSLLKKIETLKLERKENKELCKRLEKEIQLTYC